MNAKAVETKEFASPGKGKRFCPHCSEVIAARSQTCPKCNKEIAPKKTQVRRTRTAGASVASVLDLLEGMDSTEITAAIEAVEAAAEAQAKIDNLGGVEVAKRLLGLMGASTKPAKKKVV